MQAAPGQQDRELEYWFIRIEVKMFIKPKPNIKNLFGGERGKLGKKG